MESGPATAAAARPPQQAGRAAAAAAAAPAPALRRKAWADLEPSDMRPLEVGAQGPARAAAKPPLTSCERGRLRRSPWPEMAGGAGPIAGLGRWLGAAAPCCCRKPRPPWRWPTLLARSCSTTPCWPGSSLSRRGRRSCEPCSPALDCPRFLCVRRARQSVFCCGREAVNLCCSAASAAGLG